MKLNEVSETTTTTVPANVLNRSRMPAWLKWTFTAFMLVLVPVYWANYGPTNFLYFCDAALFLALFAIWKENALAASMAAVGILVPQFFWCVDFGGELLGFHMTGMTSYLVVWILALFTLAYVPTHLALTKLTAARARRLAL
jgi:hypothetical protein